MDSIYAKEKDEDLNESSLMKYKCKIKQIRNFKYVDNF